MIIQMYPSGPFETNAYIVACSKTKEAVLVDPAPGSAEKLSGFLQEKGLLATKILLTHSHWDHIGDVAWLKRELSLPVWVHPLDLLNLEQPGADGLPCWMAIEGVGAEHLLEEGETFSVGTLSFEVIHTPGHTPGGVCFYCKEERVLISGDTLFRGSIGNLAFPTSDAEAMWHSLHKLAKLPPETVVYPGHGPSTTIGSEPWLENARQYFG